MENNNKTIKLHIVKSYGEFSLGELVILQNRWIPRHEYAIYSVVSKDEEICKCGLVETEKGKVDSTTYRNFRLKELASFDEVIVTLPEGYRELRNRFLKIQEGDMYFRAESREFVPCVRSVGGVASDSFRNSAVIITKRTEKQEEQEIEAINSDECRLIQLSPHSVESCIWVQKSGKHSLSRMILSRDYKWKIVEENNEQFLMPLRHPVKPYSRAEDESIPI